MKLVEKKLTKNEQELYVKLIAITEVKYSAGISYRQVEISNENFEKPLCVLIPSKTLASVNPLKRLLLSLGHRADVPNEYWVLAHTEITKQTSNLIVLCDKPGYSSGDVYLCINDDVIGKVSGSKPVLHPNAKKYLSFELMQGTLNEWKKYVAPYALHSPQLMLALCSAFLGFLLNILGVKNGGFHLWGESSTDKNLCLYMLASVIGEPDSTITPWSNTNKRFEEIALAHNDGTLILGNGNELNNNPIIATKTMLNRMNAFMSGKGKVRTSINENSTAKWQLAVFITGKCKLEQYVDEHSESENMRIIDVPADTGRGMGIFESLPKDVNSSNELAAIIKDTTHRYYGSAKPAFLKRLIADIQGGREDFKHKLESEIEYFMDKHYVNRNSSLELNIANHFALAYVGGFLAVKYGVLPFKVKNVMNGISKCFMASLNTARSPESVLPMLLPPEFLAILKSGAQMNLINNVGFSKELVKGASAVLCKVKGKTVLAVDAKLINDIMDLNTRKSVLKELTRQGFLLSDNKKKYSTVQISYEKKVIGRRYCFVESKLANLLND